MSDNKFTVRTDVYYYKDIGRFVIEDGGATGCCDVSFKPIDRNSRELYNMVAIKFDLAKVLIDRPPGHNKRGQLWRHSFNHRKTMNMMFLTTDMKLTIDYDAPFSDHISCEEVVISEMYTTIRKMVRASASVVKDALHKRI